MLRFFPLPELVIVAVLGAIVLGPRTLQASAASEPPDDGRPSDCARDSCSAGEIHRTRT